MPDLHIIFDGPPGPTCGRFIECENSAGASVGVGEWNERPDGYWELVIPNGIPPTDPYVTEPVFTDPKAGVGLWPRNCDGVEQDAFEEWAKAEGFVMDKHPIHWLFLNSNTYTARQGWKAGLVHASERCAATPSTELTEARAEIGRLEAEAKKAWTERNIAYAKVKGWEAVVYIEGLPMRSVPVEEWGPAQGTQTNIAEITPKKLTDLLEELARLRAKDTP